MKKILLFALFIGLIAFCLACETTEDLDLCTPDPQEDCICTEEYDPVCGCDGKVYSNACDAECNGIFDYTPGDCQ